YSGLGTGTLDSTSYLPFMGGMMGGFMGMGRFNPYLYSGLGTGTLDSTSYLPFMGGMMGGFMGMGGMYPYLFNNLFNTATPTI
ncbi:hypothetical protein JXL19_04170, partial [bacterium]|nr:hypothetical protein [bacterium]